MGKLGFEDWIATVDRADAEFVTGLHQQLLQGGCTMEIKEAKSGYLVSYLYHKKALANYVFRKKGMLARIYGNHILDYMELLETLPEGMVKAMEDASVCKRLLNPDACNSKCAMGYDFILRGRQHKKCRNNAFFFLLCPENNPFIEAFLKRELAARAACP